MTVDPARAGPLTEYAKLSATLITKYESAYYYRDFALKLYAFGTGLYGVIVYC